ncbi:MAG: TVP38/TMEM64 family protein [Bdellovibrionota bacterium]
MKKIFRVLLGVIASCGVFYLFYHYDLSSILTLHGLKTNQTRLNHYFLAHPYTVCLIYFVTYVGVTALSLPGATILTLGGGAIFGVLLGSILVSFASTLGATCAFLISRYVLRNWVQKRFSKNLKMVNEGVKKDGRLYLLVLRLLPVVPFFVVNFLMGLTSLPSWTFMWVSQLGMLPATVIYVNAGTQLAQIQSLNDILTFRILLSLSALGLLPIATKFIVSMTLSRKLSVKS